jgi:hypothetical protein
VYTVQVVREVLHLVRSVWPNDEGVIHTAKPADGLVREPSQAPPPRSRLTQDLHSATSQKNTFFIVTAVKASNRTSPFSGTKRKPIQLVACLFACSLTLIP